MKRILVLVAILAVVLAIVVPLVDLQSTSPPTPSRSFQTFNAVSPVSPPATFNGTPITHDCSTNVTTPLGGWLQSLPVNSSVVIPNGYCYSVSNLVLTSKSALSISGGTWKDPNGSSSNVPVLDFSKPANLVLSNMTVNGQDNGAPAAGATLQSGIRIDGGNAVTMNNITVNGVYGDGVFVNALSVSFFYLGPSSNVRITNLNVKNTGASALRADDVTTGQVSQLQASNIGGSLISSSGPFTNEGLRKFTVSQCTLSGNHGPVFNDTGAGAGTNTTSVTVQNCTETGFSITPTVVITTPTSSGTAGPYTFSRDTFTCGLSRTNTPCTNTTGANVTFINSSLNLGTTCNLTPVYSVTQSSTLVFNTTNITGFSVIGTTAVGSVLTRTGGVWTSRSGCGQTVVVPTSIDHACGTDVTSAINNLLSLAPAGSTIDFPVNACYLVSNTYTGFLTANFQVRNASGLTINGNGSTFHQTTYNGGSCTDVTQPILNVQGSTNVTFNDMILQGPGTCGGAGTEGDIGILVGKTTPGNTNITFNNVTVNGSDGDGMDVYPNLGTCCGINTNITFKNGAFENIGYHVFVPEGVNGWNILNNTFSNESNFMDLEIDNNYGPPYNNCNQGPAQGLTGNAMCNITIQGNTFLNASAGITSVSNGTCIPFGNMIIKNNTFDNSSTASQGNFSIDVMGSDSNLCPRSDNLQIDHNVVNTNWPTNYDWGSTSIGAKSPCGGTSCAPIEVSAFTNVVITNNVFLTNAGSSLGFGATPVLQCISFQGVGTASLKSNTCANAATFGYTGAFWFMDRSGFPNTNISECGNTYGLTNPIFAERTGTTPAAAPLHDTPC